MSPSASSRNRSSIGVCPLLLILLCAVVLLTTPAQAQTRTIDDPPAALADWQPLPYAKSTVITGITFDESTRRTEAPGSDIWPITWADDDHQYAAFGDGGGFHGSNSDGRVSLGVTRIEGGPKDYRGINVWGGKDTENPAQFNGKGTGIISIDGILYMWVSRPKMLSNLGIAVSRDHSSTWELPAWNWTYVDGIFAGTFINAGKDYTDAPDRYVYACFTRVDPAPEEPRAWLYERPGRIDLARAPKNRLLDRTAWEWFGGMNANGQPTWSADITKRTHTFEDPNSIKVVSVCYQPALRRYLLTYNPRDTGGNFALFEAPHPWGPWREVAYLKGVPMFMPPKPNTRVDLYHFAPKWWSPDGRSFTLVFNVGDDAWNTVRGRLNLP